MTTQESSLPGSSIADHIYDETSPLLVKGKSSETSLQSLVDIDIRAHSEAEGNALELRLKNSGSVARDHLASERTYLAYVRTSLALSSAGVALMQFMQVAGKTRAFAIPFASAFVVLGVLILLFGTRRYFIIQRSLISGFYPTTTLGLATLSFTLGSLITIVFAILLLDTLKH